MSREQWLSALTQGARVASWIGEEVDGPLYRLGTVERVTTKNIKVRWDFGLTISYSKKGVAIGTLGAQHELLQEASDEVHKRIEYVRERQAALSELSALVKELLTCSGRSQLGVVSLQALRDAINILKMK